MPGRVPALVTVIVLSVVAIVGVAFATAASAAPVGAATNLRIDSQTCHANGTVSALLLWTPSGLGQQAVQLATDVNFNRRSEGGPYASNAGAVSLTQLQQGATYYARVLTGSSVGTLASDTIVVNVRSCAPSAGITKPTDLDATAFSDGRVRFDWRAGENNVWYCVDTAPTLSALQNLGPGWRNHGCWTTSTSLLVSGLACNTNYYWLVYAWNTTGNVKSDPEVVNTGNCSGLISPPTDLNASRTNGGILFDWDAGAGNIWYCVDTAPTQSALLNLGAGWQNHGCWTTATQLLVSGLDCGETYYWLVYTWNHVTNTKSAVASVQTAPCAAELQLAPIVDVDVFKTDGTYAVEITAALPDACHTADSHRVRRFGNTIEITVWNSVEPGPCAFVYGEYELSINLGSDFDSGERYDVIVNDDKSDSFIAD